MIKDNASSSTIKANHKKIPQERIEGKKESKESNDMPI